MAQAIRSLTARNDLLEIWLYIAKDSIDVANRLLFSFEAPFASLAENPMMGRSCEDLVPEMRSYLFKDYLIFYKPIKDGIVVVRVLHGARNYKDLF